MSGFAVIHHRDGSSVSPEVLASLIATLSMRGPDGCDQVVEDWVGLAHQHFWTTPEEAGELQPLTGAGGRLAVVFDGRLDNRGELLARLGAESFDGEAPSDARLVIAAFERWGERFCEVLIGPFAVVVADFEKRRILCGRDPLGDRTLFYHLSEDRLVVASEESAVLAHPGIRADLNETRLACFFALHVPNDGSTFFREVRELPPGELLMVGDASVQRRQFWRPSAGPSGRRDPEAHLIDEFRELLRQAVRCRLRAAEPPAVMLSGGLDSTSAAALGAAELQSSRPGRRLRAVSWVFDEFESCDERAFMDPVVDRWRLRALRVVADDAQALSHQEGLCLHPSTPEDNVYRELKRRVWELAVAAGSRVVLNCAAADALYTGGRHWFVDLARTGHPTRASLELLAEVRRRGLATALRRTTLLRGPARLKRRIVPPLDRELSWLQPEAHRRVAAVTAPRFGPIPNLRAEQVEAVAGLRAARSFSLEHGYGARSGIELRDPYRDLRLVEFMLRLPGHLLYRHGRHKHIAREAMNGWLPESILERTEPTFLTPLFDAGLRRTNREAADDLLASKDAIWRHYVKPDRVAEALRAPDNSAIDVVVWRCLSFELWRRRWSWVSTAPGRDVS